MRLASWLTHLALLAILATPALSADPVGTVHGSGVWGITRGEFPNHQPMLDKITVSSTLNSDGTADGIIVWTSIYNAAQEPGQGTSGWTWQIRVESWSMFEDGTILLSGTITHSQIEEEAGLSVSMSFFDGGLDGPDRIGGAEIKGGIQVQGP